DHRLGGLHRHQVLVQADRVARLDVPLDDGGVGQAFAKVGEVEGLVFGHGRFSVRIGSAGPWGAAATGAGYDAASVRLAASTMRAVDGMYFISSRISGMWVS